MDTPSCLSVSNLIALLVVKASSNAHHVPALVAEHQLLTRIPMHVDRLLRTQPLTSAQHQQSRPRAPMRHDSPTYDVMGVLDILRVARRAKVRQPGHLKHQQRKHLQASAKHSAHHPSPTNDSTERLKDCITTHNYAGERQWQRQVAERERPRGGHEQRAQRPRRHLQRMPRPLPPVFPLHAGVRRAQHHIPHCNTTKTRAFRQIDKREPPNGPDEARETPSRLRMSRDLFGFYGCAISCPPVREYWDVQ